MSNVIDRIHYGRHKFVVSRELVPDNTGRVRIHYNIIHQYGGYKIGERSLMNIGEYHDSVLYEINRIEMAIRDQDKVYLIVQGYKNVIVDSLDKVNCDHDLQPGNMYRFDTETFVLCLK